MGAIQIREGEAERLIVLLPYTPERVAKIKTVAGRRWHQQEKHWTVPQTNEAIAHLLDLFAGEPVEIEPSLRPVNGSGERETSTQPGSDQTAATTVRLLDRVRQAIRTRHDSYRTEEA